MQVKNVNYYSTTIIDGLFLPLLYRNGRQLNYIWFDFLVSHKYTTQPVMFEVNKAECIMWIKQLFTEETLIQMV